jgi:hypothetical protein
MATYDLQNGFFALVDDGDLPLVSQYRYNKHKYGYAIRSMMVDGTEKKMAMHRDIMGPPPKPGLEIDHINRNKLDNRRANLRWATRQQNCRNSKRRSKTGFTGVTKTPGGNYQAMIYPDSVSTHLGMYDTAEEAARAYDKAAKRLYGEFARLNFP